MLFHQIFHVCEICFGFFGGGGLRGFARCDVEFQFRFCAAGAHANPISVFKVKFESVCLGKVDIFDRSVRISLFAEHEIALRKHLCAVYAIEGGRANFAHDVCHFLHAVKSAERDRASFFDVVTKLFVEVLQHVVNAFAHGVEIANHLCKRHACNDCVLISCMRTHKRAVAFFEAEEIGIFSALFPLFDFFADKLKAGENVEGGNAVACCKLARKFGGDDCFDKRAVFGEECPFLFCAGRYNLQAKRRFGCR